MGTIYGLVVCGGESSRMGMDKSLLVYYDKPQRYHLYDMLQPLCDKVFISCNKKQASTISEGYEKIVDLDKYENIGPMAALLSAFELEPDACFLVVGCDYPFIRKEDLQKLVHEKGDSDLALSYVNPETFITEPLLGIYCNASYPHILEHFLKKEFSLKNLLNDLHVKKIEPSSLQSITSVDTPEAYEEALNQISQKRAQLISK
jgi:molybdopterin-guanine dinucleotide biosynthesis protein A